MNGRIRMMKRRTILDDHLGKNERIDDDDGDDGHVYVLPSSVRLEWGIVMNRYDDVYDGDDDEDDDDCYDPDFGYGYVEYLYVNCYVCDYDDGGGGDDDFPVFLPSRSKVSQVIGKKKRKMILLYG